MFLLGTAIQDVRCSKVSNYFILFGYSISILYQCMYQQNISFWFQGVAVPIALLFFLFYLKMLGAADVKVLSVLGGFLGWKESILIFFLALLYGLLWAIYKFLRYHNFRQRISYFKSYVESVIVSKKRIPYLDKSGELHTFTIPFLVSVVLAYLSYIIVKEAGVEETIISYF